MGQSVSADAQALQLNELLSSDDPNPQTAKPSTAALAGIAAHHVRAWKFEDINGSYKDVPMQLADGQGRLTMDLQTTASYLILHVHSAGSPPQEDSRTDAQRAALGGIARHASATCTPRGLVNKVSQGSAGESSSQLDYAVFVWHGMGVDPLIKVHTFGKAFELDRQLRGGLLWQRAFLDGMRQAVQLTACAADAAPAGAQPTSQVFEEVDQITNRLINMIAKGGRRADSASRPTPARRRTTWSWRRAPSPGGGAPSPASARGVLSYPLLSLSVWRSLGVAAPGAKRAPRPVPQLDGLQGGARRSPLSSPRQHSPRGRKASSQARVEVPRLALGSMHAGTAEGNPKQWPHELPQRPQPAMGTPSLSSNLGDLDLVASARSGLSSARGTSVRRTGSRSPPRMMSPRGLGPRVSPEEPDAVAKLPALNLNMVDAVARLDDNEDKRHLMRPSELKQMELMKYQEQCSEIVPKQVYISSYVVACNLAILQRHEITHILNLAADVCESRFQDKFKYATYYCKDVSSEDISMLFYRTLEWMQAAILAGGRVLVHCREGVSRSATMVIAYLMWTNHLPFKEAHEIIRRVRPICNPNPGFTYHLLELGKRLGTGTPGRPASGPQALLFRVRPHHPKNPFLLLEPTPKPQSPPLFDPRFGWVVRCDRQLVLWLGSQVPDVEAVQAAVLQHAQYLETFEKSKCHVTVLQEGHETPVLWQALGLPAAPAQKGRPGPALAAVRSTFDADYEVARASAGR